MKRAAFITNGAQSVIFAIIFLTFSAAEAQSWKHYPYHPSGSVIYFPRDEGRHSTFLIEWWYTTAHLTGANTNTSYSIMLCYFIEGFRIFNIANESAGEFYPNTASVVYTTVDTTHLDIKCATIYGPEQWVTKKDSDTLVPFQYHLEASSPDGSINLDYDTMKRPLMVGGDGLVPQGDSGESYYYTQTMLAVVGTLTVSGNTEPVTGAAWIDRQWMAFALPGEWEWFSYQLSDSMDFNVWNIFTQDNQIPDTVNYRIVSVYVNEDSQMVSSDFELKRTQFWDAGDGVYYSHGWEFNLGNIHLTITPVFDDQEVSVPFRFYEGSCIIEGIVGGDSVTGVAFAELTHHYEIPIVEIIHPANGDTLSDSVQLVTWSLYNPDDGTPLLYSLSYRVDTSTFIPIVAGIEDTFYLWDISGLPASDNYCLLLTGYSVDSTLVGIDTTKFSIIGISEDTGAVGRLNLYRNYPNPFNSVTSVRFSLAKACNVSLKIFNLVGQEVNTLFNGNKLAGNYKVQWNGLNQQGNPLPTGIYFYTLRTPHSKTTKKLLLMK